MSKERKLGVDEGEASSEFVNLKAKASFAFYSHNTNSHFLRDLEVGFRTAKSGDAEDLTASSLSPTYSQVCPDRVTQRTCVLM